MHHSKSEEVASCENNNILFFTDVFRNLPSGDQWKKWKDHFKQPLKRFSCYLYWEPLSKIEYWIRTSPELEELVIGGYLPDQISPEEISNFPLCFGPKLKKLHLVPIMQYDVPLMIRSIVEKYPYCNGIQDFKSSCSIIGDDLKLICRNMPNLEVLNVFFSPDYNWNNEIFELWRLSKLKKLLVGYNVDTFHQVLLNMLVSKNQYSGHQVKLSDYEYLTCPDVEYLSIDGYELAFTPEKWYKIVLYLPNLKHIWIDMLKVECACESKKGHSAMGHGCISCENKFWSHFINWEKLRRLDITNCGAIKDNLRREFLHILSENLMPNLVDIRIEDTDLSLGFIRSFFQKAEKMPKRKHYLLIKNQFNSSLNDFEKLPEDERIPQNAILKCVKKEDVNSLITNNLTVKSETPYVMNIPNLQASTSNTIS